VTSRIGLDGVESAFDAMRRGEGVRAVIVPEAAAGPDGSAG
jgi:Zn-dependent alcohol dehydrogenase